MPRQWSLLVCRLVGLPANRITHKVVVNFYEIFGSGSPWNKTSNKFDFGADLIQIRDFYILHNVTQSGIHRYVRAKSEMLTRWHHARIVFREPWPRFVLSEYS